MHRRSPQGSRASRSWFSTPPEARIAPHASVDPFDLRGRLRTTNGLERLNKEIKRRTRVATIFPNEASLLRLASAVLSEISDDWETERAYLTMEAR